MSGKWLFIFTLFLVNRQFVMANEAQDRLDLMQNFIKTIYNNITHPKSPFEETQWPKNIKNLRNTYDYIVIGAGTAGSVVASRLSENPATKVLVIEAGGDPPLLSEISSLSLLLANTSYTWNDYAETNPSYCQAMKTGRCYWPRGKMLGGSGGINGNVFLEGRPDDFDEWQQQGNKGWSWQEVQPYFEKAKLQKSSQNETQGSLVLNHFQRLKDFDLMKSLLKDSLGEAKNGINFGIMDQVNATIKNGLRQSTGKTYLARIFKKRKNLHILKNSEAVKLHFKSDQAIGVEFVFKNRTSHFVRAKREIIVSAGALNTPKLLMLSGIGPSRDLNNLNLTIIKDLPVGHNLQDHGMMPLSLKFSPIIPKFARQKFETSIEDFYRNQTGALAASSSLISFIHSRLDSLKEKPDIMLVSEVTTVTRESNTFEFLQFKEDIVQNYLKQTEQQMVLQLFGLLLKPKSRGQIKLRSSDPFEGPMIINNYADNLLDRETLIDFVRIIQYLIKTPAFQFYGLELVRIPLEECDIYPFDSLDYWSCYIKYFYISAWHAAGTCRMGPISDSSSVVDDSLRVHGLKGLRVIDASIMPNITSANTYGPTIMIGEKGAQLILDDWLEGK